MKPEKIQGNYKKKKTELERLDERIEKAKQAIENNGNDEEIKNRLRKLQSIQLNILKRQIRVLKIFIQYDQENNYERREEI